MTATFCEAPAFRLTDLQASRYACKPCLAVDEILQLRHDADDHALALTLLRGHRPDLDDLAIEGAITELLDLGNQVDRLTSDRYDRWLAAVELYVTQLHAFTSGGAR